MNSYLTLHKTLTVRGIYSTHLSKLDNGVSNQSYVELHRLMYIYRWQLLRICNDSTSNKLIIFLPFRIVNFTSSLIAKSCPPCFLDVAHKSADPSQRKLTLFGTLTLKYYLAYLAPNPST